MADAKNTGSFRENRLIIEVLVRCGSSALSYLTCPSSRSSQTLRGGVRNTDGTYGRKFVTEHRSSWTCPGSPPTSSTTRPGNATKTKLSSSHTSTVELTVKVSACLCVWVGRPTACQRSQQCTSLAFQLPGCTSTGERRRHAGVLHKTGATGGGEEGSGRSDLVKASTSRGVPCEGVLFCPLVLGRRRRRREQKDSARPTVFVINVITSCVRDEIFHFGKRWSR